MTLLNELSMTQIIVAISIFVLIIAMWLNRYLWAKNSYKILKNTPEENRTEMIKWHSNHLPTIMITLAGLAFLYYGYDVGNIWNIVFGIICLGAATFAFINHDKTLHNIKTTKINPSHHKIEKIAVIIFFLILLALSIFK